MPAPVAQWLFGEAASGTTPTTAGDSQASPVDLTVTFAGAAAWISDSQGNGVDYPGSGTTGAQTSGNVSGNKIGTLLNGRTQATVELVARYDAGDNVAYFACCNQGDTGNTAIFVAFSSGDSVFAYVGGQICIWGVTNTGTNRWSVVYDTAQATQNDRVKLYKNGTLVTNVVFTEVAQNRTFSTGVTLSSVYCSAPHPAFPPDGAVFYAALYDAVLSDSEVAANHTDLAANHDVDPNVIPPAISSLSPTDGATGVSVSSTLAITFDQTVQIGTGDVRIVEDVPPVAAPTVQARNTDAQNTNGTTFTIDIPGAGSIAAGDLAIIAISKDDNEAPTGTWPPTGWEIGQSDATGTTNWAGWIYRWCDGSTDGTTVAITESSENWLSRGWLIRGADLATDPVGATVATGTSAAANPPDLTFPWGADPTLVLYYVGFDGNSSASAHPGGYTQTGTNTTTDGTTTNRTGQAYGELASTTAGSDNPGALTNTNEDWKSFTIGVRGLWTRTVVETIDITDGGQVSVSSDTVTITPTGGTLEASTQYHVEADEGTVEATDDDAPWLGIDDVTTWNFTTGAAGAGAPPPLGGMRNLLTGRLPHLRM